MDYRQVRQLLVSAGVEIKARGSNGAQHPESWREANRERFAEGGSGRAQLDEARKKRWDDPAQHAQASERLRGVWETDLDWRDKHSETLRRLWDDPERPLARHWDDPEQRERQRQAWLKRIEAARNRGDKVPAAEVDLRDALRRASLSFTAPAVILDGLYIVDALLVKHQLVIEADGASHNMKGAADYDEERQRVIENAGYSVIRFSNQSLADDADCCVSSLGLPHENAPVQIERTHGQVFGELNHLRSRSR
jgi:very-short-patch-repair endonuclease